ncbi:ORF6C domain-containing protein (plasmid) [Bacillus carboniphilus]|uniref:ORF6C domain-containing protein n=1 Tax=Bacillus carboniphilus TaxID=86663 RepID=A0ABY9K400_9BACI|nr:ORF6C domain-containing protein [Bacillus carboniphilus]WLR44510.1 ORF6C domain-containing protein [Bacillus carboniphilus]
MNLQIKKSEMFETVLCDIWENENGEVFMTLNQLANALGYASKSGVENIINRNDYLKESEYSSTHKMWVVERNREVTREMRVFTELGIYEVAMLAKTEKAKKFRLWIGKILKALRKEEVALVAKPRVLSDKEQLMASMKLTIESVENIKKLDTRMDQLETKVDSQITLDYGEQRRVQKSVAKKVYSLTSDPIERKSLFAECYRDLKDRFGVGSYKDIRRKDKGKALQYINAWIPRADAS